MSRKRRGIPEINAGSMADIAFLLLIFFLVTTTMEIELGIARQLPPITPPLEQPPEIHKRNLYVVLLNGKDEILVGIGNPTIKTKIDNDGNIMFINREGQAVLLKDDIKKFIRNNGDVNEDGVFDNRPGSSPTSSDNPDKAIVALQAKETTTYKAYLRVQDELTKVYKELRDEESQQNYGMNFSELIKQAKEEAKNKDSNEDCLPQDCDCKPEWAKKVCNVKNAYPMKITESKIKNDNIQ